MSKEDLDLLYYKNKVRQLEFLLEQERVKCFGLKRLICEARLSLQPLLTKLDRVRKAE